MTLKRNTFMMVQEIKNMLCFGQVKAKIEDIINLKHFPGECSRI